MDRIGKKSYEEASIVTHVHIRYMCAFDRSGTYTSPLYQNVVRLGLATTAHLLFMVLLTSSDQGDLSRPDLIGSYAVT